ncbi:YbaB/EbfC family nucleoid-associated protein [Micromonospora sp. NPDC092111]|uniref:YbaB/EbfC family nucleoid-associated protein n=1 Tax=Micromonospora sp. NPDC092111 TaxID=3364289 RepID=UPI003813BEA0
MTMPDFRQLTEQLARFGSDMQRAREEFEAVEVHGSSPDGAVRATMRSGKLAALTIDPRAMEQEPSRLADQVLAAVRDCEERSSETIMKRTAPMAGAMEKMIEELR